MKKALVTGANGFVGSALVRELIANQVEVIALDQDGCNNNIPSGARFIPCDLNDANEIFKFISDNDIDVFYHFAWVGLTGEHRGNAYLQLNNVKLTIDCLYLAKKIGCSKFICAGSIMEYEALAAVFEQKKQPGIGYVYGGAKIAARTMCKCTAAEIGIDLVWAEITNAYGAGEISDRFINTTIRKIINHEPLQFTSGTQNYDFVYITDVARAFYLLGENGKSFCHYLIGSSNAKPLREFVLEMKASIAPEQDFVFGDVPFTGTNLPIENFDCSITEQDTGFKASVSFAEGVKLTMNWLKEQL